jgi:hypothetical protein
MTRSRFVALLSLSLTACGPLIQFNVTNEKVCHKSRQAFVVPPGSTWPGMDQGGEFLVPVSLPDSAAGATLSLRLGTVTLSAPEGVTGFGFISKAKLSLLPPAGGTMVDSATVELARSTQSPTTMQLVGDRGDLAPYLMAGTVKWTAQLETDWLPPPFQADVEVCGEVGLHFEAL